MGVDDRTNHEDENLVACSTVSSVRVNLLKEAHCVVAMAVLVRDLFFNFVFGKAYKVLEGNAVDLVVREAVIGTSSINKRNVSMAV